MKGYICNMISTIECYLKQRGYFVLSLLLLFSLVEQGCKSSSSEENKQEAAEETEKRLPEDFIEFFRKFHTDSSYQINHITFPLEGLPNSSGDTLENSSQRFFWQRDGWQIHKPFTDPSHQFAQWYEIYGDRMIEHWVWMKGTNLFLKRRFAKLGTDGEWYLIYYAGMRPNSEKLAEKQAEAKAEAEAEEK